MKRAEEAQSCFCGKPFKQYDPGKGAAKLYCCRACRNEAQRRRRKERKVRHEAEMCSMGL